MRQYGITKCIFLTVASSRDVIPIGELVYSVTIRNTQGLMTMCGCFIPVSNLDFKNSNGGVRWIKDTRLLRLINE